MEQAKGILQSTEANGYTPYKATSYILNFSHTKQIKAETVSPSFQQQSMTSLKARGLVSTAEEDTQLGQDVASPFLMRCIDYI